MQRDIVVSHLPHWDNTRVWVLARPLSGFAETFSHYLMDIAPAGGSDIPEPDKDAEGALFVAGGQVTLKLSGTDRCAEGRRLRLCAAGLRLEPSQPRSGPGPMHWIRKLYQRVPGLASPSRS